MQPGLGHAPVAPDGADRNMQHLGCLFQTQPAKKTQLDGAGLPRIELFEHRQRVIQRHQIRFLPRTDGGGIGERDPDSLAAAFRRLRSCPPDTKS